MAARGGAVSPVGGTQHAVQFYEDKDVLEEAAAHYFRAGLAVGEPVVVIARASRVKTFCDWLSADGVDVDRARSSGQLTLLEAEAVLSAFMVDGMPDRDRFSAAVRPTLDRVRAGGSARIRAYGEMVSLLWQDGNTAAALRLEALWNDLARDYPLTLLCAYSLDDFSELSAGLGLGEICEQHSRVFPAETFLAETDPDSREFTVRSLQKRARALHSEVQERRRLEGALRASEREFQDFVENAAEGLHSVGPDGTILWANAAELELLGYARDEYVGHPVAEFHVDRAVIDDILARLWRNEIVRDRAARLRRKDGSIREVVINANVLFRDGQFVRTRCFTRDVTERRRLEAEREGLIEGLRRTVRFSEMFLGILGHDLRNPLNAIATSTARLARRPEPEDQDRLVRRIAASAGRMSRMIDQILDFTRIRLGGGLRLHRRAVDLKELVEEVVEELQASGEPGDVRLRFEGDVAGEWDSDRISQVVSNLAGNALQHRVEETPVRIGVDGRRPELVSIVFQNEGAVPRSLQPVLFEPLHGRATARTAGSSGLGLGLYISQQIVASHGGRIEVSTPGDSESRIVVELPRGGAASAAPFGDSDG